MRIARLVAALLTAASIATLATSVWFATSYGTFTGKRLMTLSLTAVVGFGALWVIADYKTPPRRRLQKDRR